jgi:protocatechuate 3,4-dioxygenase beta subunit
MKLLSKKGFLAILFVILFGIMINSCDDSKPFEPEPTKTGELQGVLENEFNEAIPFADIEIVRTSYGKTTVQEDKVIAADKTDEDGNYKFTKLPDDFANLTFKVKHPDLQPYQVNLAQMLKGKDKKNVKVNVQCKSDCCGEITIKVISDADSSVISGAAIKLYQGNTYKRKAMTDKDGLHVFEKVCEGSYWVRIFKKGYEVKEIAGINIKGCDDDGKVYLTVFLTKENNNPDCKGILKVNVKNKENGDIVKQAFVKLMKDGSYVGKAYSKDGVMVFDGLCEGGYKIIVTAKGYLTEDANVKLGKDEEKEITIELQKNDCCEGVLNVKVIDEKSNPIEKSEVTLWQNGQKVESQYTDKDGKVRFDGICEGKYIVEIIKVGYKGIEFAQYIQCNANIDVVKVLYEEQTDSCNGKFYMNIIDEKGNPVKSAMAYLEHNNQKIGMKKSNENGAVSFTALDEGKYHVTITKRGYEEIEFDFYLKCDEVKEEIIQMKSSEDEKCCHGVIQVSVQDDNGYPLKYVAVKLFQSGKMIDASKTSPNGYMEFIKVCEGTYTLLLTKTGYKEIETKVEIGCDETIEVNKQMEKISGGDSCFTAIMKLQVFNENKESIEGAKIIVYLNNQVITDGETNKGGFWYAENLEAPATYSVTVTKDGYKSQEFEMKYDKCKTLMKKVILKQ